MASFASVHFVLAEAPHADRYIGVRVSRCMGIHEAGWGYVLCIYACTIMIG